MATRRRLRGAGALSPAAPQAAKGGVQLQVVEEVTGDTPEQWRGLLKAIGGEPRPWTPPPSTVRKMPPAKTTRTPGSRRG